MDSTVLISDLKFLVSYTTFAGCKTCPDRWKTAEKEKKQQTLCQIEYLTENPIMTEMRNETRPDTPPLFPMISIVGIRTHDHMKPKQWSLAKRNIRFLFATEVSQVGWNAQRVRTHNSVRRKKEEIWLSPMTKARTQTEMSKGQSGTKNATKKSITQRLRTDLGRSYPNQTGVVKPVNGIPTFPLNAVIKSETSSVMTIVTNWWISIQEIHHFTTSPDYVARLFRLFQTKIEWIAKNLWENWHKKRMLYTHA